MTVDGASVMNERGWWYNDEKVNPEELNYEDLYREYQGTILFRSNCGVTACGNADCCRSTGPNSYIYFLPGELEYQKKQKSGIPFQSVSTIHPDRLHCDGSKNCIYDIRPLDCRSYPFFPYVSNGSLIGYFDAKYSHACPLKQELRTHLFTVHKWWSKLLLKQKMLEWAEICGENCKDLPVISLPTGEGGENG